MPQIGPLEIAVVLLVALLVFGPSKLPEVGKQAARGLREFRQFQANVRSDLKGMFDEDDHEVGRTILEDDDYEPPDTPDEPPALEPGTGDTAPTSDDTRPPGEAPPAATSQ
jgi:TatA/E family protein of Tat protein translocase